MLGEFCVCPSSSTETFFEAVPESARQPLVVVCLVVKLRTRSRRVFLAGILEANTWITSDHGVERRDSNDIEIGVICVC